MTMYQTELESSKATLQERIQDAKFHIQKAIETLEDPKIQPQLCNLMKLGNIDAQFVRLTLHEVREMRREIPLIKNMLDRFDLLIESKDYKLSTEGRVQSYLRYTANYIGCLVSPFIQDYQFFKELYNKVFSQVSSASECLED